MNDMNKWLNLTRDALYPQGIQLIPNNRFLTQSKNRLGQYLLLVQLDKIESSIELPAFSGIDIDLILVDQHSLLVLTLLDEDNLDKFSYLCEDLAEQTSCLDGDELIQNIFKILQEWSNLFTAIQKGISEQKLIGLLGELYALYKHFIPTLGPESSLKAWIGPLGSKQDFVLDNISIEVKSHRVGFTDKVSISSVEQLDNPIANNFYLYKADFSSSGPADNISLNYLREQILQLLSSNSTLENEFRQKFNKIASKATELQSNKKFNVVKETIFSITDDFPMIRYESLDRGIIKTSVKYDLDVQQLEEFISNNTLGEIIASV